MKKRKKRIIKLHRINMYILVGLLTLTGIVLTNILFQQFTEEIIAERDGQLFNLADSIDNNLTHELNETRNEFSYLVLNDDYQKLEQDYLATGDLKPLQKVLNATSIEASRDTVGVLLEYKDQLHSLTYSLEETSFSIETNNSEAPLIICKDDAGEYYLALRIDSNTSELIYYVLISFQNFYTDIVPAELWTDNWIVFYDRDTGVATQNHDNQPSYLVMTEEEILARDDGYTIILENEQKNQMGAETYQYPNYYKELVDERIITIPSCETQNGIFAIGISRDSQSFYQNIRTKRRSILLIVVLISLLGCCIIYNFEENHYFQLEMQKELEFLERENELTKQLTEAQIQNSVHQMQPHFMFNAMSSIRELILDSPQYAADMLYEFTLYLRTCIKAMGSSDPIPFTEEVRNIEVYTKIEQMRFGSGLKIVWDIQDADFDILPLSVQPLVENAIRHGVSKKRGKRGTVTIHSEKTDTGHLITVTDDGVGFDTELLMKKQKDANNDSIGLKNTVFRMEHTMHADVNIESTVGEGTKITILIPFSESEVL